MIDETLKAMKRSAKAILRDELRKLRADLKAANKARMTAEAELICAQRTLQFNERTNLGVRQERDAFRKRASQVVAWANANRPGDLTCRCLTEYMQQGPTPLTFGAGGMYVNPFDRWQVSPAIR